MTNVKVTATTWCPLYNLFILLWVTLFWTGRSSKQRIQIWEMRCSGLLRTE